ncbi:MAG: bifunctional riboflavin kinase/FAD synthetase [Crocinitomicaceae bacterium]|nr:bifunctional riboflavin kinase/FAD synthetase [Crocinitomicaceae bacterium]
MKIFKDSNIKNQVVRPLLTIGTFDGIHIGHQEILRRLISEARSANGESVLFTFNPHPREVVFPENHGLKMLTTLDEKMQILDELGLDNVILFPFTEEFSKLSAKDFVQQILVDQIGVQKVVIGYDHHFGNNREGNIELLKELGAELGFEVEEIPAQDIDHINVSSTKIRNALKEGKMEVVTQYLGRPFEINGIVVEGNKIGRTLGFPTANIEIGDEKKMLPCNGAYVVQIGLKGQVYRGMMNIGFNPTHNLQHKESVEVFIHQFEGDIYGEKVKIEVLTKIRNEQKFASPKELREQLKKDEDFSLNYSH